MIFRNFWWVEMSGPISAILMTLSEEAELGITVCSQTVSHMFFPAYMQRFGNFWPKKSQAFADLSPPNSFPHDFLQEAS